MLNPPTYPHFEDAYLAVLEHITSGHRYRNSPRGNASRECLGLSFQLIDPRQRLVYLPARQVNPIFHYAEALWYLTGRSDLEMISYYAPRMRRDSRDGTTIVGSAYGHRMFTPDDEGASPFDRVLRLLRTEPDSKRGVLPIFQSGELAIPSNPDVSCAVALQLLAREGELHMVCYMRANDCDRGLLADVFSFTLLQEFAAIQLRLKLGMYIHHIGSAHLGERDLPRVEQILAQAHATDPPAGSRPARPMPADTDFHTLGDLSRLEEALRHDETRLSAEQAASLDLPAYWQQVALLFEIKRQLVHRPGLPVDYGVLAALDPGLSVLVGRRWPKRMPESFVLKLQR